MSRAMTAAGAVAWAALMVLGGASCSSSSGQTYTPASGGSAATGSGGGGAGRAGTCGACDGCCDGTQCVPTGTQSIATCGKGGEACAVCDAGFTCSVGHCVVDTGQCSPASCPSGCCVNNVCIQPNTQDWSACGSGGTACGLCDYGAVCAAGACTNGIDDSTQFSIVVTDIEVTQHDANGSAWDAFGGLPDPYACVQDGQGDAGCTSYCSDTTSCVPATATITDSSGQPALFTGAALKAGLTFTVYDKDLSLDDTMGTTTGSLQKLSPPGYSVPPFGGVVSLTFKIQ